VLAFKEWAGLARYLPVDSALTLINGSATSIKAGLRLPHTALVFLGVKQPPALMNSVSREFALPAFSLMKKATRFQIDSLRDRMKEYHRFYVFIHDERARPQASLDYSAELLDWIGKLGRSQENTLCFLSNAYTLSALGTSLNGASVLISYQDSPYTENSINRFLEGKINASGKLPVRLPKLMLK